MARLVMLRDNRTKEYELGSETVLGRKSTCTIRVPSPKCSREHCRIIRGSNGFFIDDMGSSNGTIVNNNKIGRHLLKNGDEITVGGVLFKFQDKTDDPLVGKRLGKYQIIDKVGVGGMGVVYRASQVTLGREVALKVMSRRLASKQNFIQSFEREAKIAARLQHPNIIGIHDFGHEADWYYFSMEFVDGENLLDMALRQGGLSVDECLDYGAQIAEALDHAHNQGILHKDIKPQNVMIDRENRVKLADMGLASMAGDEPGGGENAEESNSFMATPQYVAPEIIRRLDPDARSDVYSLAATLFHMLTGKPPYQAENVKELLKKHLSAPIPDPRELRSDVPEDMALFIMRGLAKEPAERVQTAREFADFLNNLRKGKSAGSTVPPAKKAIKQTIAQSTPVPGTTTQARAFSIGESTPEQKPEILRYALIAAGGLTMLILLLVLLSGGNPEKEAAQLMAQAQNHYVLGEDEAARRVLQKIVTEFPRTVAAKDAREMQDMYRGSRAKQEVYRVRSELSHGKTTPQKAARQLKLFLRQGNLSREDEREIVALITELGEDPDIRSEWERKIDDLLGGGAYYEALAQARASAAELTDENEKRRAEQVVNIILSTIDSRAKEYYEMGKLLQTQGSLAKALESWRDLLVEYPQSDWAARAAQEMGDMNLQALREFARAWNLLRPALSAGNFAGARETAFQTGSALSQGALPNLGKDLETMMQCFDAFYTRLLAVAEERTANPPNLVKMMIEGKEREVTLAGEDGKLFAVGQANRKEIKLTEVPPMDLARIMPARSSGEQEVLGAALFFLATGQDELAKIYLSGLLREENLSSAAGTMRALRAGVAPLADLDELIAGKSVMNSCRILNNRIVFFAAGHYESPLALLTLDGVIIDTDFTDRVGFELRSRESALLLLQRNGEQLEVSVGEHKGQITYPQNGLRIRITHEGVALFAGSDQLYSAPAGIFSEWGYARFIASGSGNVSAFLMGIATDIPTSAATDEEGGEAEVEPPAEG